MKKHTISYTVNVQGEITDLEKKLDKLKKNSQSEVATVDNKELTRYFTTYEKHLNAFKKKASMPIKSPSGFDSLQKELVNLKNAGNELERIFLQIKQSMTVDPSNFWGKEQKETVEGLTQAIQNYQKELAKAQEAEKKISGIDKKISSKNEKIEIEKTKKAENRQKLSKLENPQKLSEKQVSSKKVERENLSVQIAQQKQKLQLLQDEKKLLEEIRKKDMDTKGLSPQKAKLENYKSSATSGFGAGMNLKEMRAEEAALKQTLKAMEVQVRNLDLEITPPGYEKYTKDLQKITDAITKSETAINDFQEEIQTLQNQKMSLTVDTSGSKEELLKLINSLGDLGVEVDETNLDLNRAKQILDAYCNSLTSAATNGVDKLERGLEDLNNTLDNTEEKVAASNKEFNNQDEALSRNDAIKERISQFVGLQGAIEIARNAMRNAIATIRELDDTMTEMAVVTEHGIGHYWDQLPEHTKRANELGVAINDVYKAETLYYQQGLKTNQVTGMSSETLKMARISGMDAADATNKMTAALRGFNMELNETSAQRVNDVYSELAAITAADTQEIANAMTKTASIASNAGMGFETTSAFLSQIIETTRESAETAGTAMKTIVARFQELKKAPGEIGEVDGEIVDANKIETALRSVGVSLRDTNGQFRNLDDVFLELSSKWDGLDKNTQRYIATIAAGSRQQSRFIAMMGDYGRTVELVDAANNSAGASQEQFEKTLESLSSKITKLKNSWDTFTTTIFDNELIGGVVDAATKILDILNEIISKAPDAVQPFLSIGMIVGGMKLGQKAVNSVLGSAGESLGIKEKKKNEDKESKIFGKNTIFSDKTDKEGQKVYTGSTHQGIFTQKEIKVIELDLEGEEEVRAQIEIIDKELEKLDKDIQINIEDIENKKQEIKQIKGSYKDKELNNSKRIGISTRNNEIAEKNQQNAIFEKQKNEKLKSKKSLQKKLKKKSMSGLTEEQKEQLTIVQKENDLTKEQINLMGKKRIARIADAQATGDQAKITKELNWLSTTEKNLRQGGIRGLLTEIGLRATGNVTKTTEIGITKGLVGAKLAEAAAWIKANSAMLIGLGIVLLIVVAIALLVGGIMKLAEAWEEAGKVEENKLKQLNKSLDEMKSTAQEAKEQLDSIAEDKEGLEELQEKFDDLTKGSREWRQTLMEINNEVIELLDKYPDLAKHITRGEHGEMQISDAGWDHIYNEAQKSYASAMSSQVAVQMQVNETESQISFDDLQTEAYQSDKQLQQFFESDDSFWGGMAAGAGAGLLGGFMVGGPVGALVGLIAGAAAGAAGVSVGDWATGSEEDVEREHTGGLTSEEFQAFGAALAEEGYGSYSTYDEMKSVYDKMGFNANFDDVRKAIGNLGTNFDILSSQAYNFNLKQQQLADSYAQTVASQDESIASSEYYAHIVSVTSSAFSDAADDINAKVEALKNDENYVNDDGEATDLLKKEYSKSSGKDLDEINAAIKDGALSIDTMVTQIASTDFTDTMSDSMKKTAREIERLGLKCKVAGDDVEGIQTVVNALSPEGRDLTQNDIDNLVNSTGMTLEELDKLSDQELHEVLNKFLKENDTSLETIGIDARTLLDTAIMGDESLAKSQELIDAFNLDTEALNGVSADVALGIMNNFKDAALDQFSGGNTQEVMDLIGNFKDTLDEEQQEQFLQVLSQRDWDTDIEGLSEELIELGIVSEDNVDKIRELEEAIQVLANTKFDVTLDEAFDLHDFKQKILSFAGEQATFSQEEMNRLIQITNLSIEQFQKIGKDSYMFLDSNTALIHSLESQQNNFMDGVRKKGKEWSDFDHKAQGTVKYDGEIIEDVDIGVWDKKNINSSLDYKDTGVLSVNTEGKYAISDYFLDDLKDLGKTELATDLEELLKKQNESENREDLSLEFENKLNEAYGAALTGTIDGSETITKKLHDAQEFGEDNDNALNYAYELVAAELMKDMYNREYRVPGGDITTFSDLSTIAETDIYNDLLTSITSGVAATDTNYESYIVRTQRGNKFDEDSTLNDFMRTAATRGNELRRMGSGDEGELLNEIRSKTGGFSDNAGTLDEHGNLISDNAGTLIDEHGNLMVSTEVTGIDTGYDFFNLLKHHNFQSYSEAYMNQEVSDGTLLVGDKTLNTFFEMFATEDQKKYAGNDITKQVEVINNQFKNQLSSLEEDFKALEEDTVSYLTSLGTAQEILDLQVDGIAKKDFANWQEQAIENKIALEGLEFVTAAVVNSFKDLTNAGEAAAKALAFDWVAETKGFESFVDGLQNFKEDLNSENQLDKELALGQMGKALDTLFGVDFSETDFYQNDPEMVGLMQKVGQGGEESLTALEEIRSKAAEKLVDYYQDYGEGEYENFKSNELEDEGVITNWTEAYGVDNEELVRALLSTQGYAAVFDGSTMSYKKIEQESLMEAGTEDSEENSWQNPYNWIYNKNNEINELIRKREELERKYQKTLENEEKTVEELLAIRAAEAKQMEAQLKSEQEKQVTAKEQKEALLKEAEKHGLREYISIDQNGAIQIDAPAADNLNEEQGSLLEAIVQGWEESHELEQDSIDAQNDMADKIEEWNKEGQDELIQMYDQVKQGLIKSYENEIEAFEELNNTLLDTQSNLINKIQEQIDQERKTRENEKTEQNIEDKQQRLNYLKMDTSGANTLEIAKLEKELSEEREDYQDTLIDQQLQKMQTDNELAREQRERQIQLMRDQLEAYGQSDLVWQDVKKLLEQAWNDEGKGFSVTAAGKFIGIANDVSSLNPIATDLFWKENAITAKLAEVYGNSAGIMETTNDSGKTSLASINKTLNNLNTTLTGGNKKPNADSGGIGHYVARIIKNAFTSDDSKDKNGDSGNKGKTDANYATGSSGAGVKDIANVGGEGGKEEDLPPLDTYANGISAELEKINPSQFKADGERDGNTTTLANYFGLSTNAPDSWVAMYARQLQYLLDTADEKEKRNILEELGKTRDRKSYIGKLGAEKNINIPHFDLYNTATKEEYYVTHIDEDGYLHYTNSDDKQTPQRTNNPIKTLDDWRKIRVHSYNTIEAGKYTYKTGGLADFTGPAWLDGTKSRPELVLNQQDTQNFIALKDILADVMNSSGNSTSNSTTNGDNYYDIEINVEGINNDYDVEQIADKIKAMIQNDAMYRNVNALQKTSK